LQCHEITAEVEEKLGKVTYTKPTAELFEEKVTITTTETVKNTNTISRDGSSGWSKY